MATVVGYTGNFDPSSRDPTYQRVQDYAEGICISYDPDLIGFQDLLQAFFAFHAPAPPNFTGTQYRSAIFYHNEEQKQIAERVLESKGRLKDFVALEPAREFYRAEEYHQNYLKKQMGWF